MSRIIGFLSVDNFYDKSKIVYNVSSLIAMRGYRVCVFDSYFRMNNVSLMFEKNQGNDLKEYISGRLGTNSVLNYVNSNLAYVKTNIANYDYESHINLIEYFFNEIVQYFDFVFIDLNLYNKEINILLNNINEVIMVLEDDNISIRNSSKVLTKLKMFKNIHNVKFILNNAKIISAYKKKCLRVDEICDILKIEVIGVFSKICNRRRISLKLKKIKRIGFNNLVKKIINQDFNNNHFICNKFFLKWFNRLRYYKYE